MTKENDIYSKLKTKFPKEAYGTDKSRGFSLDTIDAYYIIERLNEVFGLCGEGWWLTDIIWKTIEGEKNLVICCATFCYIKSGVTQFQSFPCVGGHQVVKDRWDDAYKSAMTNAICKGASFLGVGLDVYKGEFNQKIKQQEKVEPQTEIRQADKTAREGITIKQKEKLQQVIKSKYLTEKEKSRINTIINTGDKKGCRDAIGWWFGKDFGGGERDRRQYIDLYIEGKSRGMGEPPQEMLINFEKEAKESIDGLEPTKIKVLIDELRQEK